MDASLIECGIAGFKGDQTIACFLSIQSGNYQMIQNARL